MKLSSSQVCGIKMANPKVSPCLAVAFLEKDYIFVLQNFFYVSIFDEQRKISYNLCEDYACI
jgi:hypothetical protein